MCRADLHLAIQVTKSIRYQSSCNLRTQELEESTYLTLSNTLNIIQVHANSGHPVTTF